MSATPELNLLVDVQRAGTVILMAAGVVESAYYGDGLVKQDTLQDAQRAAERVLDAIKAYREARPVKDRIPEVQAILNEARF